MASPAFDRLISELESLFSGTPAGHNPAVLKRVREVVAELIAVSKRNAFVVQKCGSVIESAEVAYASRKRSRCPRENAVTFALDDVWRMKIHVAPPLQHGARLKRSDGLTRRASQNRAQWS
jgi:hypothetical protein